MREAWQEDVHKLANPISSIGFRAGQNGYADPFQNLSLNGICRIGPVEMGSRFTAISEKKMTSNTQDPTVAGVLLVLMEPPASMEEEYNDWYDTEHLPQRLSLPGILDGSRWVCQQGWPRWAAIYSLTAVETLLSTEYLAVSGRNSTPWSKRILPRMIGMRRVVGKVASESDPLPVDLNEYTTMSLSSFSFESATTHLLSEQIQRLRSIGASHVCAFSEGDDLERTRIWFASFFDAPVVADDITRNAGRLGERGAILSNTYIRYKR